MATSDHVVENIVADSGAFLRNAPLQSIGMKVFTLPEVVSEIRDKATRQRLQVLPYELEYRQPSVESIRIVSDFSKKTGDYPSLSAVDIRVMALSYQLEKEYCGVSHIKSEPAHKAQWTSSQRLLEKPTDIAGFYLGAKEVDSARSRTTTECSSTETNTEMDENEPPMEPVSESMEPVIEPTEPVSRPTDNEPTADGDKMDEGLGDGEVLKDTDLCEDGEESGDESEEDGESEEEDEDEDDGGGWITPSNIRCKKREMMQTHEALTERVKVGCLTTDFAMQNVLLQMGLNVVSVDGMLIKRAKSYVLRCHACMKITKNMMKQFCPHCGNHTLKRVSVTVNEDGSLKYFLSTRKAINTRGMRFSLAKPKGGKHANNPVLVADQPMPQQRPSKKSLQHLSVTDPDYQVNTSPFSTNDVTSRAAILGIRGGRKNAGFRNPNMNRRGRRK